MLMWTGGLFGIYRNVVHYRDSNRDATKHKLGSIRLGLDNLRGQGYDGAGKIRLVRTMALILNERPLAFYTNKCMPDEIENEQKTWAITEGRELFFCIRRTHRPTPSRCSTRNNNNNNNTCTDIWRFPETMPNASSSRR